MMVAAEKNDHVCLLVVTDLLELESGVIGPDPEGSLELGPDEGLVAQLRGPVGNAAKLGSLVSRFI